jgi:hypothetical protein
METQGFFFETNVIKHKIENFQKTPSKFETLLALENTTERALTMAHSTKTSGSRWKF